jgi:hypothetical protein
MMPCSLLSWDLHRTQNPPLPPANKKTIIDLSEVLLEKAACSALSKGLKYAVAPAVLPVEDYKVATQQTTWCHIPDDTLHNHCCENLKSFIIICFEGLTIIIHFSIVNCTIVNNQLQTASELISDLLSVNFRFYGFHYLSFTK